MCGDAGASQRSDAGRVAADFPRIRIRRRRHTGNSTRHIEIASVVVQKFASPWQRGHQNELLKHNHTRIINLLVSLSNPKFAKN
jgi:hypothetical protein